jgi:hypothetical protein
MEKSKTINLTKVLDDMRLETKKMEGNMDRMLKKDRFRW